MDGILELQQALNTTTAPPATQAAVVDPFQASERSYGPLHLMNAGQPPGQPQGWGQPASAGSGDLPACLCCTARLRTGFASSCLYRDLCLVAATNTKLYIKLYMPLCLWRSENGLTAENCEAGDLLCALSSCRHPLCRWAQPGVAGAAAAGVCPQSVTPGLWSTGAAGLECAAAVWPAAHVHAAVWPARLWGLLGHVACLPWAALPQPPSRWSCAQLWRGLPCSCD